MPRVSYSTLAPTNDPVTYDDVTFYPGSNIIDTFASLRTPKVHAFGLDALEIASSGKVAYTLNDLHSLDMVLGVGSVDLVARNSNALLFANEDKSAVFKLRDDGAKDLDAALEAVEEPGGVRAPPQARARSNQRSPPNSRRFLCVLLALSFSSSSLSSSSSGTFSMVSSSCE